MHLLSRLASIACAPAMLSASVLAQHAPIDPADFLRGKTLSIVGAEAAAGAAAVAPAWVSSRASGRV